MLYILGIDERRGMGTICCVRARAVLPNIHRAKLKISIFSGVFLSLKMLKKLLKKQGESWDLPHLNGDLYV